jgi:hypothetical protein
MPPKATSQPTLVADFVGENIVITDTHDGVVTEYTFPINSLFNVDPENPVVTEIGSIKENKVDTVSRDQGKIRGLDVIKDCDAKTKIDTTIAEAEKGGNSSITQIGFAFDKLKETENVVDNRFQPDTDHIPWIKTRDAAEKKDSGSPVTGLLDGRVVFFESGYGANNYMKNQEMFFCRNIANEKIDPLGRNFSDKDKNGNQITDPTKRKQTFFFPSGDGIELSITQAFMSLFGVKNCEIKATRTGGSAIPYGASDYDFAITAGAGKAAMTAKEQILFGGVDIFAGNEEKNVFLGIKFEDFLKYHNELYLKKTGANGIYNYDKKTVSIKGHPVFIPNITSRAIYYSLHHFLIVVKELGDLLQVLIMLIWTIIANKLDEEIKQERPGAPHLIPNQFVGLKSTTATCDMVVEMTAKLNKLGVMMIKREGKHGTADSIDEDDTKDDNTKVKFLSVYPKEVEDTLKDLTIGLLRKKDYILGHNNETIESIETAKTNGYIVESEIAYKYLPYYKNSSIYTGAFVLVPDDMTKAMDGKDGWFKSGEYWVGRLIEHKKNNTLNYSLLLCQIKDNNIVFQFKLRDLSNLHNWVGYWLSLPLKTQVILKNKWNKIAQGEITSADINKFGKVSDKDNDKEFLMDHNYLLTGSKTFVRDALFTDGNMLFLDIDDRKFDSFKRPNQFRDDFFDKLISDVGSLNDLLGIEISKIVSEIEKFELNPEYNKAYTSLTNEGIKQLIGEIKEFMRVIDSYYRVSEFVRLNKDVLSFMYYKEYVLKKPIGFRPSFDGTKTFYEIGVLDVLSPSSAAFPPPAPSSDSLPSASLPSASLSSAAAALPPPPTAVPLPAPSSSKSKPVSKPYAVPKLPEEPPAEEVAVEVPRGRPTRDRKPRVFFADEQFGGAPNEPPKEMYNFPLDSNQFWFMMEPSKTLYKDDLMLLKKIISTDTITEEIVKANPTVFNSNGAVSKFGFYNPFIIMNNQIWDYLNEKGMTVYYDHVRNKLYDMGYCTVTAYYDDELYEKIEVIVKEIDADPMYGFGLLNQDKLPTVQTTSSEQPEVVQASSSEQPEVVSSVEQRPATTTSEQPGYYDQLTNLLKGFTSSSSSSSNQRSNVNWLSNIPLAQRLVSGGTNSKNRKTMKKHKHKKTIKKNKKIKRFQTIKHKNK